MAKLHEILAVEGGLEATARKIVEEARDTFAKKPEHFIGMRRELRMFDDADRNQDAEETKEMVTTVSDKLDHVSRHFARYLNAVGTKESTNQTAHANLVVDGEVIAENLPVTFLLGLETKLTTLRETYLAIPTLAPGRKWELDAAAGRHVWRDANQEVRMKTQKTVRHKILVEPTKEHPAQIEKWHEDVPVGRITTSTWSGMLSSAQKSDMLERIDKLIRAVKRARMRANNIEVVPCKIGERLFSYINYGNGQSLKSS